MYVIAAAMKGELRAFRKNLDAISEETWGEYRFTRGVLQGHEVVLAVTGVGKVLSAAVIQRLIDLYRPQGILFVGLAGSLNRTYAIGDLVIAHSCIQWDMEVSRFGFKRGHIPYSGFRVVSTDSSLLEAACTYKPDKGRLYTARVLTGDTFLTSRDEPWVKSMVDELEGDAVDMEGYSVCLTASLNRVPVLLIRIISDDADGKIRIKLARLLVSASKELCRVVVATLNNMPGT
jgi:5'-methylthioadenosine/S-adenosylhomocysteine nucleosidase